MDECSRRRVLALGSIGIAGFAGCTGGSDEPEPATTEPDAMEGGDPGGGDAGGGDGGDGGDGEATTGGDSDYFESVTTTGGTVEVTLVDRNGWEASEHLDALALRTADGSTLATEPVDEFSDRYEFYLMDVGEERRDYVPGPQQVVGTEPDGTRHTYDLTVAPEPELARFGMVREVTDEYADRGTARWHYGSFALHLGNAGNGPVRVTDVYCVGDGVPDPRQPEGHDERSISKQGAALVRVGDDVVTRARRDVTVGGGSTGRYVTWYSPFTYYSQEAVADALGTTVEATLGVTTNLGNAELPIEVELAGDVVNEGRRYFASEATASVVDDAELRALEPERTSMPEPETTPTQSTTPAGDADHVVEVGPGGEPRFEPADLTVSLGDTVKWVWRSDDHNVRPSTLVSESDWAGSPGEEDTLYDAGFEFSHTFEIPTDFDYYCAYHPGMTGVVRVR